MRMCDSNTLDQLVFSVNTCSNFVLILLLLLSNLPQWKAYTKGKACTRCQPQKRTLQLQKYTTNK